MNKARVISSLIYKFTERFAVKGIGLVISIILARLLSPEHFGQLAIMNVFIVLSQTFIDGGLNTALVQSKEADDKDYSTVFYICTGVAAVMVVLLIVMAPVIGRFYNTPGIVLPLRVYSFSLFLGAFNSIQVARIQRELKFKQQLKCSLAATIVSGFIGAAMAFAGFGIWALVAYYFMQVLVNCLAMLTVIRWVPNRRFSVDSAKRLYSFGLRMFLSSILTTLYNNIRPLIIGKQFSDADLGLYDRGSQFSSIIAMNIDTAVQSVMFPVFSSMQDDKERLLAVARRAMGVNAMLVFPAMFGMAAIAEPMVLFLLKEKWIACVIFVQLLCIGEAQIPITTTNLVILKSLGRSDIYMKLEFVRRVCMLVVLAISVFVFKSVVAIAAGFVFSAWLDAAITSVPLKKLMGYWFPNELKDVWKTGAATIIMALVVYALGMLRVALFPKLVIQLVSGAAVYAALCYALRSESFMYVIGMIKKRRTAQ